MPQNIFRFRQFAIRQEKTPARIGTDGILLGAWAEVEEAKRILDIGTGTGLIALMAAQRNADALVHAVELESASASEAELNFAESPFGDRLQVFQQDLRQFSPPDGLPYDVVLSNPPFFRSAVRPLTESRANWRHQMGMGTEDIFVFCRQWLASAGHLCLVLPVEEGELAIAEGESYGFHCTQKVLVQPSQNKPINRFLLQFSRMECDCQTSQITIQTGGANEYSAEYVALTRGFYPWMEE